MPASKKSAPTLPDSISGMRSGAKAVRYQDGTVQLVPLEPQASSQGSKRGLGAVSLSTSLLNSSLLQQPSAKPSAGLASMPSPQAYAYNDEEHESMSAEEPAAATIEKKVLNFGGRPTTAMAMASSTDAPSSKSRRLRFTQKEELALEAARAQTPFDYQLVFKPPTSKRLRFEHGDNSSSSNSSSTTAPVGSGGLRFSHPPASAGRDEGRGASSDDDGADGDGDDVFVRPPTEGGFKLKK